MTADTLWARFCAETQLDPDTPHTAWAFGDAPDKLADLVLRGIKTATASAYDLYFLPGETEALPAVGDHSVILNAAGEAVCVIRTTRVRILPFCGVDAEQAFKEGEGDRSLTYWREVHESFFTREFSDTGLDFTPESRVVCEEFAVVCRA